MVQAFSLQPLSEDCNLDAPSITCPVPEKAEAGRNAVSAAGVLFFCGSVLSAVPGPGPSSATAPGGSAALRGRARGQGAALGARTPRSSLAAGRARLPKEGPKSLGQFSRLREML